MIKQLIFAFMLLLVTTLSIAQEKGNKMKTPPPPKRETQTENVGTARMEKDGTLFMQFHSIDNGMVAEALRVYKPTDKDYQKMVNHLGGIKPGQSKEIPPFNK